MQDYMTAATKNLFQELLNLNEQIITLNILQYGENREEMADRLLGEMEKIIKKSDEVKESYRSLFINKQKNRSQ
ncbi:MAG: hypothetical protein CMI54_03085 [Parcubacteria group bacterium]|nr:hypothetical protein [Parcubacteria group bacterium]|tara:strand:+ start:327 stop:548 length:222 start_codon:yes stop_codon:yes gene_type:complete